MWHLTVAFDGCILTATHLTATLQDPTVLYVSLHRYGGGFYPGTGAASEVGKGTGAGFNINVAFSGSGYGDAEYLAAFDRVVMPVARQFAPELVMISAGFDAAAGDPLGGMRLTPVGYAHMTALLGTLAAGKMVVALEGGYNLRSISRAAAGVMRVLLGGAPPPMGQHEVRSPRLGLLRPPGMRVTGASRGGLPGWPPGIGVGAAPPLLRSRRSRVYCPRTSPTSV